MPWIGEWLPYISPQAPRDFVRTPFALSILQLHPGNATFLSAVDDRVAAFNKIVQILFKRGGAPMSGADALHPLIIANDRPGVKQMLAAQPRDLNARAANGHTPLTLAALLARGTILQELLARGAHIDAPDALGNTALHWATVCQRPPLADFLVAHGARATCRNLFAACPKDYDDAWRVAPPDTFDLQVVRAGDVQRVRDAVAFANMMGFDYMPQSRPGVDFFVQLIVGMAQPQWLHAALQVLPQAAQFAGQPFTDVPMFFKDFGPPWGWGVCAGAPIKEGDPVTSYSGDIVHAYEMAAEAIALGQNRYACKAQPTAALQALFNDFFDARRAGNFGSRINSAHVPDAACLQPRGGFARGLPLSMFFAKRPIAAGEQLSWFYGDGYWSTAEIALQPLPA